MQFSQLEEKLIKNSRWKSIHCFVLEVEDSTTDTQFEVIFSGVHFSKTSVSYSSNVYDENEIWKAREVAESKESKLVYEEKGFYWLRQIFGGFYARSTSVKAGSALFHLIVLSDYIDLEILCDSWEVNEMSVPT
jgi:hypothetical protein